MPLDTKTCRLAIAGASSLRGRELKQMLEKGRFASSDIRLVDEELAAGTLTELAGEPAVIQAADDDSFEGAKLVFFTGSAAFAMRPIRTARARLVGRFPICVSTQDICVSTQDYVSLPDMSQQPLQA